MNNSDSYMQRIREICPDLSVRSAIFNAEGLCNDVVIINDELVFRFSKDESASNNLTREINILRLLKNNTTVNVPAPFYESHDCIAYRLIPGEALRRDLIMKLDEDSMQSVANQLATFHKELHGVPVDRLRDLNIPIADALMEFEGFVKLYEQIEEKVFPCMLPHAREWARNHFESFLIDERNFEYEAKLIHGDLGPYHVMYDQQGNRVNGIIDFGCAGLGDPAIDFAILIQHYGESVLNRFYRVYPEIPTYMKRARFYAGTWELRWALIGIESGDISWFMCHIGDARDINFDLPIMGAAG
jgi:aminoglycoside 2''-phosphotransferase